MSLVQLAAEKNAVEFQRALHEKIESIVDIALADAKIEVAASLFGEGLTGILSPSEAEGGEKTREAGGMVGKNRLPNTTDIKTSAPGIPNVGAHISGVTKKPSPHEKGQKSVPGDNTTFDAKMPGKAANEETQPEKPSPHEQHQGSKGKRAMRMAMKKKYDKRNEEVEQVDEKIINTGSVEHMAHAVHSCARGHCPVAGYRGTFTHYDHPDYAIHKDHGGIGTEPTEHNYYVVGHGGVHKFGVKHTKHGIDVTHAGQVS
jgi:hypothetical protein